MGGFCHADGVASSTAVDLLTDGAAAIWILDHRGGGGAWPTEWPRGKSGERMCDAFFSFRFRRGREPDRIVENPFASHPITPVVIRT